ncbi:MAG: hypothetical protein HF967_02455 [Methanosarcinales archaeon]|nr:hypothetical protein [Methanosarcinales archaeon]
MKIPFRNAFDYAKLYDKYANYVLWISTLLIIIAFLLKVFYPNLSYISNIINKVNCLFIVAYAVLNFITDYIFYKASYHKRLDFIDNSFNTSYSEENSSEYYSNDDIENGIYKLAVNSFENSLFTYIISKKMLIKIWIKNTLIALIFLVLAIFGYENTFVLLLQLALPILLLSKAIKLTIFVNRVNQVYENYRKLFQNIKSNRDNEFASPEILINVIEYEATLSWGSILLDSKIYNSMNDELSKAWEEIKIKYEIK